MPRKKSKSKLSRPSAEEKSSEKGKRRSLVSSLSASLRAEGADERSTEKGSLKDRLSPDVLKSLLHLAKNSRTEVLNLVGNELGRLVSKIDLSKELTKVLVDNKIKISAEIEFVPKSVSASSSERGGLGVRRGEHGDELETENELKAEAEKTNRRRDASLSDGLKSSEVEARSSPGAVKDRGACGCRRVSSNDPWDEPQA